MGVSSDCEECELEYEVVCEEIEDPDATNGVGWECTDVFIGLNCYPIPCPGGGGEDPDDCSNPNNYNLPECSFEDEEDCEYYGTCDDGGGNDCGYSVNSKGMRVKNNCGEPTTPVVDIIDLITDPNADCILSNLLNNTFFNNLVHDFKNNKNLNLTFTMGSPVDNYGNPVTGQTSHSYGTKNFTITINQSYFNQVGGLEATKTFMHEAFHANLWIKAQEWYPTDLPANFQNLSLVAQIQYLDQRGGNSGPQHDYMASEVNSIATALQSYTQAHYPAVYSNPNISFESYKAMAYRGLEMTERYTDYVNSLQGGQSSFNSFYGLLAAGTQSKCP